MQKRTEAFGSALCQDLDASAGGNVSHSPGLRESTKGQKQGCGHRLDSARQCAEHCASYLERTAEPCEEEHGGFSHGCAWHLETDHTMQTKSNVRQVLVSHRLEFWSVGVAGNEMRLRQDVCRDHNHWRFLLRRSTLLVAVDRRREGCLTLGEFTEYIETLVEVANNYKASALRADNKVTRFARDVSDSALTLLRDLRYGVHLLKKLAFRHKLSNMERAILKRTFKDLSACLPYCAIALTKCTYGQKILMGMLLYSNAPYSLFPTSLRKPRRRFARAWAAIAAKQRRRAYQGWQRLEDRQRQLGKGGTFKSEQKELTLNKLEREPEKLFEEFDEGSGTLTYGEVFSILWPLCEEVSRKSSEPFLDALGLVLQIASDRDGAVTKPEFVEFVQTLTAYTNSTRLEEDLAKPAFAIGPICRYAAAIARKEVREVVDSVSMISQDVVYSGALLQSLQNKESKRRKFLGFSKVECDVLRRTAKDTFLFIPIGLIIVAPLTPALA